MIAVAMAVACTPRAGGPEVGRSDRPSGGSSARVVKDAGAIEAGAGLPADYRSTFKKLNASRFVSQGHAAGRWDVDVWANELAEKAIASRARDVPVGAIVVQEHFEKVGSGAGPVMAMEKRAKGYAPDHGDWRYTVVGSSGQLVKEGVVDSCAGCHDDAPMDGFFPLTE